MPNKVFYLICAKCEKEYPTTVGEGKCPHCGVDYVLEMNAWPVTKWIRTKSSVVWPPVFVKATAALLAKKTDQS